MRRFWLCVLGVVCGCPILTAGQIYGTVRDANGKGMAGVQIVIVSPAKTTYEGKTGPDGSYQIFVKENGRCEFQARLEGKAPATASVFSYADPSKYEFELVGGNLKAK
jgi:Carboxypeptidase regulatory-like domain